MIEIETYAWAGVDHRVRRGDMAFKFREVPIRVIVANPLCVVKYAY